jgi:hypothetical protein
MALHSHVNAECPGRDYEERLFNMNMQSRTRAPIGTTARTGERCPESGVWQAIATPTTTAPIAKGNVMPPYRGSAVSWKLIRYA